MRGKASQPPSLYVGSVRLSLPLRSVCEPGLNHAISAAFGIESSLGRYCCIMYFLRIDCSCDDWCASVASRYPVSIFGGGSRRFVGNPQSDSRREVDAAEGALLHRSFVTAMA
jgi:hypothetical protein